MRILESQSANAHILYDATALCGPVTPELFTRAYWQDREAIVGEAPGRGASVFFDPGDHASETTEEGWVLRPYRRGGMVARVSQQRYVWCGSARTRAAREFRLTVALREKGLSVPQTIGACVWHTGFFYEGALITVRIPGAQTLADCIESSEDLPYTSLRAVGALIRKAHELGLDHVDLNARNLLLDRDGKPWIIDLDRCRIRNGHHWQARNMERLERSLTRFAPSRATGLMHEIRQGYLKPTP
ncbi:3-deoxy-D-manno-octulosonic acid kinase [Zymobacter sp. IVIA_5232.4 C2]|uniref:3-deoxy-D-manno-octulosonic acid kinase n=1 Tax=Zymobacter sp. IVIA_5232.4 C2 TaxID=3394855 RepID=UPI0039C37C82